MCISALKYKNKTHYQKIVLFYKLEIRNDNVKVYNISMITPCSSE